MWWNRAPKFGTLIEDALTSYLNFSKTNTTSLPLHFLPHEHNTCWNSMHIFNCIKVSLLYFNKLGSINEFHVILNFDQNEHK